MVYVCLFCNVLRKQDQAKQRIGGMREKKKARPCRPIVRKFQMGKRQVGEYETKPKPIEPVQRIVYHL